MSSDDRLTITACHKCHAPVIHATTPLALDADPTALTPLTEAHAWITATDTYAIRTLGRRQWLLWRNPSPRACTELVTAIRDHATPALTILAEHTCPAPATSLDHALSTWLPADRAAIQPPVVTATAPTDHPDF